MKARIGVLVLVSLALVKALPLNTNGNNALLHKDVKRSAELVLVGNHQNHERDKKSGPGLQDIHHDDDETDSHSETDAKHDEARDETAKVSVETNNVDAEPHIDETKTNDDEESSEQQGDSKEEESAEKSKDESKEENADESTEDSGETTTKEESEGGADEAAELAELKEELPRLSQKERDEIDLLLSELNLPPSSPLYRDFKRSSNRVQRWHASRRRRRAHPAALESSMSLKPRTALRAKRETWYPFMLQQDKRQDYTADYPDYPVEDFDPRGGPMDTPYGLDAEYYTDEVPEYDDENLGYDIPLTDQDANELLEEIAEEMAEEEEEKEAEEAAEQGIYPIQLGRGPEDYYIPETEKRQYQQTLTNGFKRSGDFYPYTKMEESPWAAAIRADAEKRNVQDQYDRLYQLAAALRGETRR